MQPVILPPALAATAQQNALCDQAVIATEMRRKRLDQDIAKDNCNDLLVGASGFFRIIRWRPPWAGFGVIFGRYAGASTPRARFSWNCLRNVSNRRASMASRISCISSR